MLTKFETKSARVKGKSCDLGIKFLLIIRGIRVVTGQQCPGSEEQEQRIGAQSDCVDRGLANDPPNPWGGLQLVFS